MKKKKAGIRVGLVVLLVVLSAAPLWAQRSSRGGDIEMILQDMQPGSLSSAEEAGILLMREEEKLARDVYLTLYEKWNIPVLRTLLPVKRLIWMRWNC